MTAALRWKAGERESQLVEIFQRGFTILTCLKREIDETFIEL